MQRRDDEIGYNEDKDMMVERGSRSINDTLGW